MIDTATTYLAQLARTVRLSSQALSRRVKHSTKALPPHLFTVLAHLEHAPATAAELAAKEKVSAPTMSKSVSELAERGLLLREPDPIDGRQKILTLTPAGRDALLAGRHERDVWMVEKLQHCTPDELAALERAADIIQRMANEA